MNFDDAKENIQPLATGRNASLLQASLRVESPQELLVERRRLEEAIHTYSGEDPLEPWYTYISWVEQCFPSGGKESGLEEILTKCLTRFEREDLYYQDRRMVKLYIKFIESHKDPTECYQQLFSAGIGTMVADFYISWAYCYDSRGNSRKADEVFRRGIACRAQPFEELQEAHQHFGFVVAQRLMYKDDDDAREEARRQLHERRLALSSLRGYRRKADVGSIRTGAVVKSQTPGPVKADAAKCDRSNNVPVKVFSDENDSSNVFSSIGESGKTGKAAAGAQEESESVVRSIIDKARHQENLKEPGPWNKAHDKKHCGRLFGKTPKASDLGFDIHQDVEMEVDDLIEEGVCDPPLSNLGIKLPPNFASRNRAQPEWLTPVTIENEPDPRTFPQYNKSMLYPRPNMEFQVEELRAFYHFRKRKVTNDFTKKLLTVWSTHDINANVRQYPNFSKNSRPQKRDHLDEFFVPPRNPSLMVPMDKLYDVQQRIERQCEELLALKFKERYDTILQEADMEETVCMPTERVQRRKSFFPIRRSVAPKPVGIVQRLREMRTSCIAETKEEEPPFPTSARKDAEVEERLQRLREEPIVQTSRKSEHRSSTRQEGPLPRREQEQFPQGLKKELFLSKDRFEDSKVPAPLSVPVEREEKHEGVMPSIVISAATEEKAAPEVENSPFEIYQDPTVTIPSAKASEFQFKTPAPPTAALHKQPKSPTDEENLSPGVRVSAFDVDETCSTQMFNIFIKSQSVSTPKPTDKTPVRMFGTILKQTPLATPEEPPLPQVEEEAPTTEPVGMPNDENQSPAVATNEAAANDENRPPAVAIAAPNDENQPRAVAAASTTTLQYSPQHQLSTILETTEHGSTQGTHTTGATTKSTLSSPDLEAEPHNVRTTIAHTELETVQEQSQESSGLTKVDDLLENLKLQGVEKVGECQSTVQGFPTPGGVRFQSEAVPIPLKPNEVGNFDRLEQREDTSSGIAIRAVCFQEDKTETIPKLLLSANHESRCFQDDKTETMSKIFLKPMAPAKFEDDKTETVPKLPFAPPPPSVDDEQIEFLEIDDAFEFFAKTPPKLSKFDAPKTADKSVAFEGFASFEVVNLRTPVAGPQAKRQCSIATPEMHSRLFSASKKKEESAKESHFPLFEDELKAATKQRIVTKPVPVNTSRKLLRDSFLSDFSLIEGTQSQTETDAKECQSSSVGAQFVKDSQPQTPFKFQAKEQRDNSLLPDLSFVPESQPRLSFIKQSETHSATQTASKLALPKPNDSFLPDLSYVPESQSRDDHASKWKPNATNAGADPQHHLLMENFMKDFSAVKGPPRESTHVPPLLHSRGNSTLKFLEDSFGQQSRNASLKALPATPKPTTESFKVPIGRTNLKFSSGRDAAKPLPPNSASKAHRPCTEQKRDSVEPFFDLNAETEMFGPNISMIKNSTCLPPALPSQVQEDSIHIKDERISFYDQHGTPSTGAIRKSLATQAGKNKSCSAETAVANASLRLSVDINTSEMVFLKTHESAKISSSIPEEKVTEEELPEDDMSIYYKKTPKTPKAVLHVWNDTTEADLPPDKNNTYVHAEVDLNQTHQIIENICVDPQVNPFNSDLIHAFLEQIKFSNYIEDLPNCRLMGRIPCLHPGTVLSVKGVEFKTLKLIGEGAYGAVYCAVNPKTGTKYALKQERPANYWEYYICLEVQCRLKIEEMLPAYMSVEYALVGNNCSVIVSAFSSFGSLITICNKIKKQTMKNVDEYVVMFLACELLDIIDHLHAVGIIHADIKADNFLLMKKLSYPAEGTPSLQLIDFGVSIDMQLFKPGQTFSYVHNDEAFNCVEMRENRAWTYQLDLYGLAGLLHVLLFGKYMTVEKRVNGTWMHKTYMPRYINKTLWEAVFTSLLNVRDCFSMPNLQQLRAIIKQEIAEHEKYLVKKINEFNSALTS